MIVSKLGAPFARRTQQRPRLPRRWIWLGALAVGGLLLTGLWGTHRHHDCPDRSGASARRTVFDGSPDTCISSTSTYDAVIETSGGTIRIALDGKRSFSLVNNFVTLARWHFYDGLVIHRAMKGTLIQTGDPTGTGHGGPGYDFRGFEPTPKSEVGTIAMATGIDTWSGSQFFILTGHPEVLPPAAGSAAFGSVVGGLRVARAIADSGDAVGEIKSSGYAVVRRIRIVERRS